MVKRLLKLLLLHPHLLLKLLLPLLPLLLLLLLKLPLLQLLLRPLLLLNQPRSKLSFSELYKKAGVAGFFIVISLSGKQPAFKKEPR
ncbi:MAG TPA: hypothetical protein VFK88_06935 [Gallionella sp.]|nr:hypothetical protein [Gallionella sp.]